MTCFNCSVSYVFTSDKTCISCEAYCLNCEIDEKGNSLCLKYSEGYILSQNKKSISCDEPYCASCESDENDNPICLSCIDGYALSPEKKCIKCEGNCENCEIDKKGNFLCLSCQDNYFLAPNKSCLNYGPNFYSFDFTIDENSNPICSNFLSNSILYNGKCFECPEGWNGCIYDESSGNTKCTECSYTHILNPNKNECHLCQSYLIQENND